MRRFRWPPPPDGGPRTWGPGPTGPRTGRPALPAPPTETVTLPTGVRVEQLATGVGDPVTVFAHGLAGDIAGTRPLGSAVTGRRVFFHARGHGRTESPPGPWTFADLAADLDAVATRTGATRALGVSMGAATLCALLARSPGRFERVVLYLPANLDGRPAPASGARLARLLAALDTGEAAIIAEVVEAELPVPVRNTPAGWSHLRNRVDQLQRDGLAPELESLWDAPAVPDLTALAAVTAKVLVLGCRGDDVHPARVAETVAAAIPAADLHIYDRPSMLWTNRADLRTRISDFLNA